MDSLTLLLSAFLAISGPSEKSLAGSSGPFFVRVNACQAERATGRRIVNRFLSLGEVGYSKLRQQYRIHAAPPDSIKALTNERDGEICTRLLDVVLSNLVDRKLHSLEPSFFRSGEYFYVALTRPENRNPRRLSMGFVPFYVIDAKYNLVASIAM
jgi:hypothetical protein